MKEIKIKNIPLEDSKTVDYYYGKINEIDRKILKKINEFKENEDLYEYGNAKIAREKIIKILEELDGDLASLTEEFNLDIQKTIKLEK